MHSEYSRAFFTTKAGECYARPESFRSRRSIGQPSQEGLPGDAHQDGPAQLGEPVEGVYPPEFVERYPELAGIVTTDATALGANVVSGGDRSR